jgi:O-antigen/teichoic acid export membrane protein
VFLLAGTTVMVAVYGDAYRAGAPVLALLSIAYLFNVWTGSCGVVLVMTGFESTLMRITVASAMLSIVASLLVAPSYGAVGVGAVVGIAGVGQNMALWFAARHHTGMWTHAAIPRLKDLRALLGR